MRITRSPFPSRFLPLLTLAVLLLAVPSGAQEAVFSGPQPGEKVSPFKVLAITGPDAGKEVTTPAPSPLPVALVFVHQVERSLVPLLTTIDQYGHEHRTALRTQVVFLSDDRVMAEQRFPLVTRSLRLRAPALYSLDGGEGPGSYGLNKKCLMTVVLARDGKATANFALVQPGIADAPKVLAELAKLAGDPQPPTAEQLRERRNAEAQGDMPRADPQRGPMPAQRAPALAHLDLETPEGLKAAVRALATEVQALRRELDALRGSPTPKPAPRELPGAAPTDARLLSLLRSFIQPTNDDATVDRVLKEVEQYVAGNADLTKQAVDGWVRVLAIPYGTPYAQRAGKAFVEKLKR